MWHSLILFSRIVAAVDRPMSVRLFNSLMEEKKLSKNKVWFCGLAILSTNFITTLSPRVPSSFSVEAPAYGNEQNKYPSEEHNDHNLKPYRTGLDMINILQLCFPKYGTIDSSIERLWDHTPNFMKLIFSRFKNGLTLANLSFLSID